MKSQKNRVRARQRIPSDVREAIQQSEDSVRTLAHRYGINPKTVVKWRHRESIGDLKAGPRSAGTLALNVEQEAVVVACRLYLRLPLDACLQVLSPQIPQLSRSSLHRCLQRRGLSRLPVTMGRGEVAGEGGQVCFELSFVRLHRYCLFVAIERDSHYAHAELCAGANAQGAANFVRSLVKAVPCSIDSLIVDGGMSDEPLKAFRDPEMLKVCDQHAIALRTIKAKQRWTLEQVEQGADLIEQALSARKPRPRDARLREELAAWLVNYNSRCVLELLGGRTPAQAIGQKPPARTTGYRDSGKKSAKAPQKTAPARRRHRSPDPINTREAILQAARKCLAHDGPEGLSLAEVARIAGVNRGTAYQHFETRDKLIEATTAGVSERLFQAVFGAVGATSERQVGAVDIAALTDRIAGFAMGNPELCRAWLLNVLSSPEPASDLFWREYVSSAKRFDRTGFSRGNVDTEVLSVIMLAGIFLWPIWAHAQYGGKQELALQAQRFADESLRISMYGNLNPERYPQVAERLGRRAPKHAGSD